MTEIKDEKPVGVKTPASGISLEEIEALGLTQAAANIRSEIKIGDNPELKRKLRTAFEFYRVVEPERLKEFNAKLKLCILEREVYEDGYGNTKWSKTFNQLHFCPLDKYQLLPPKEVLVKLREAKEHNCFDTFLVATLQPTTEIKVVPRYKDPILFGMIKESPNLYYITQWGDDVKIEDILKESEG